MTTTPKLNVFLDLDATIISSEEPKVLKTGDQKKILPKMARFTYHDMDGEYIVFERPNLQKFLTFLFDNFNVSVWTAAAKTYGTFVVDRVILGGNSNRKIDYVFFTDHCKMSEILVDQLKGLNVFWNHFGLPGYRADNTIILDDNKDVYQPQPDNAIIVPAFEFSNDNSEDDKFLVSLETDLRFCLEQLKNNQPLGPIIRQINAKNTSNR